MFLNTAAHPWERPPVQLVEPPRTLDGDSSAPWSSAEEAVAPADGRNPTESDPLAPKMWSG